MRKIIGHALTATGAFLLIGGALVRFHMAPELIGAPVDTYTVTRLEAADARLYDAAAGRTRTGVRVVATNTTRGDVKAARDGVAVWDSATIVQEADNGKVLDVQKIRASFDRRTGRLTNCCGASVQDDRSVRQSGVALYWPLNLQQRDQQVFDIGTRRSWTAEYDGKERVDGVLAYRFVMRIPATQVTGTFPELPPEMLGLPKGGAAVPVHRYVQQNSTFWVDPRTGAPIDQRRKVVSSLRPQTGGPGELVVADFELRMSPDTRKALVTRSQDGAETIRLLEDVAPLAATGVGLITLSLGVALTANGRGRRRATGAPGR